MNQTFKMTNGVELPAFFFGVYQIPNTTACEDAVNNALAAGYRAIDTAASYGNEAAVGRALPNCGVARKDLFVTSKLWVEDASEEIGRASCRERV